jgi:hypothetical protein
LAVYVVQAIPNSEYPSCSNDEQLRHLKEIKVYVELHQLAVNIEGSMALLYLYQV